jgi:peptidyl-Asp metalloendopeptidase
MVAYTPNAATQAGGSARMLDLINATITGANTAYQNSGINQRLRLVRTYETTNYNSTGDFDTDLERLKNTNDGFIDEIHGMRDSAGADVVSLWTETTSSCGIAYILANASTAFNVVAQGCANGNLSFVHELGHNMGARHDWFVVTTVDNPTYNHGYVNTAGRWRTVMAIMIIVPARASIVPALPIFQTR